MTTHPDWSSIVTNPVSASSAPDLASITVTLRGASGVRFQNGAVRSVHAALHRALERDDPALSAMLHDHPVKPMALTVESNATEPTSLICRIYPLHRAILRAIVHCLSRIRAHGERLSLDWQPFALVDVRLDALAGFAELRDSAIPARNLEIEFVTPAVFRNKGRDILAPRPEHVFGGLLRRWQSLSTIPLSAVALDRLDDQVSLVDCKLHGASQDLGRVRQRGFVGRASYRIGEDDTVRREVDALSRFGEYAGVGARTAFGMGRIRLDASGHPQAAPECGGSP